MASPHVRGVKRKLHLDVTKGYFSQCAHVEQEQDKMKKGEARAFLNQTNHVV